jgi:GT2 family glycosyltransferase
MQVAWQSPHLLASVIIPTRDQARYLRPCLNSILRETSFPDYEIILVDSGSREEATRLLYEELCGEPRVRRIEFGGEFNFSAALNLGAREARGDVLVFLNNDTEVLDPGWLSELVRWACRPEIGVAGAQLRYPDGDIQHAGIILGMEGHASHVFAGRLPVATGPFGSAQWYRNYSAVTGACMAVRRAVFEQTGGFDERFELVFSDVEFCLRVIQAGFRVVYSPFACLIHYEGRTRARHIPPADIRLGRRLFGQIVKEGDPFYNANLSLSIRIPALRRPWEEQPLTRLEKIVSYYS